jgi:PadR family transcriptional regulator PadR
MSGPTRVTGPLLDVLAILVEAAEGNHALHGWEIKKSAGLSGPTTYKIFDRLEDAGWITGHWEEHHPDPGKPPRRFYRLTPTGYTAARALLAERRPEALRRGTRPSHTPLPGPLFGSLSALGRFLPGGAK